RLVFTIGDPASSSRARDSSASESPTRPTAARYIAYSLCASAEFGSSSMPRLNSPSAPGQSQSSHSLMCPSATCASPSDGSSCIARTAAAFASEIASTQNDPRYRYASASPAYATAYLGSLTIACCRYSIDFLYPSTVPWFQ